MSNEEQYNNKNNNNNNNINHSNPRANMNGNANPNESQWTPQKFDQYLAQQKQFQQQYPPYNNHNNHINQPQQHEPDNSPNEMNNNFSNLRKRRTKAPRPKQAQPNHDRNCNNNNNNKHVDPTTNTTKNTTHPNTNTKFIPGRPSLDDIAKFDDKLQIIRNNYNPYKAQKYQQPQSLTQHGNGGGRGRGSRGIGNKNAVGRAPKGQGKVTRTKKKPIAPKAPRRGRGRGRVPVTFYNKSKQPRDTNTKAAKAKKKVISSTASTRGKPNQHRELLRGPNGGNKSYIGKSKNKSKPKAKANNRLAKDIIDDAVYPEDVDLLNGLKDEITKKKMVMDLDNYEQDEMNTVDMAPMIKSEIPVAMKSDICIENLNVNNPMGDINMDENNNDFDMIHDNDMDATTENLLDILEIVGGLDGLNKLLDESGFSGINGLQQLMDAFINTTNRENLNVNNDVDMTHSNEMDADVYGDVDMLTSNTNTNTNPLASELETALKPYDYNTHDVCDAVDKLLLDSNVDKTD